MKLRHCLLAIVIAASGCETAPRWPAPRQLSHYEEATRLQIGLQEERRLLRSAKVGDQVDLRFLKPRPDWSDGDTAGYFVRTSDEGGMIYIIDREGRIERITEHEQERIKTGYEAKLERESDERHALQKLTVGMQFSYVGFGVPERIHEFGRRSVYVFERGGVWTRITVDNQTHQIVDISRTY